MIPLWLTNIWVRRAILAVVVVIALLAVRQHYINLGKTKGVQQEVQHSIQGTEQVHVADRDQVMTVLNNLQIQVEASERRQETLTNAILSLATKQQQAKTEVAGMTKQQVTDLLAQYTSVQLADCVKEWPICEERSKQQAAKISEVEGEVGKLKTKFTTLGIYTGRLEGYYAQAWNDASMPRRGARCLWLAKCVRPQIKVPDPKKLFLEHPADPPAVERNANDAPAQ